ncbi:hypothetical protein BBO99_00000011 [Phytophthora kernoviae]|uniref:Jacalin-type lectin domain-containing protein n=1 Tax=Phytophthora kernoviae TaxID=325452 RepID=A0A3R7I2A1_9STRA|nr:hypothetical protein JM18_000130 [Phytophthora kernoviae]RLN26831.1 hypothetical protein BBI17_000011 [Phytophthora kernoviae]RLN86009.1 hypothetical protein BBO99_00000011 [Phytophthora kernoviae]
MQFAADGLPEVTLLRSSFTNAYARSVDGQELIKLVEKDIVAAGLDDHPELEFKHAVVLGCSRYNTATRKAEGHTALGGGKVGIFGSCGLHTWPAHLGEVTSCCLNNTRIDQSMLLDDSCFRGTFWANFSTGIGAMLHEIGHTFGLGHATSGIMARGFDDMNRILCVYEADPRSPLMGFHQARPQGWLELNHSAIREVTGRNGAHWNAGSAQLLRHCPWISGFAKPSLVGPTVSWDDSVRGPVGYGQYNGNQVALPEGDSSSSSVEEELGVVMVDAGKYVNRLETLTRAQLVEIERTEPLRAAGDKHWFVLAAGEYITRVDIRSMAWIDGLQLHTNLRSSRCVQAFDELANQLHSSLLKIGNTYQLHCVTLDPGERVVQIDASFRPAGDSDPFTVIDGVCFHTTARCSSWFGKYRETSVRFFMAPADTSVIQLRGAYTGSILTDLTGMVGTTPENQSVFIPDGRVLTDSGAYDVRLEAASPVFGIETALLVKKKDGDNRDAHAWPWKQGQPPRVWRLPHKMLEDPIPGADRKSTLFQKYIIGAIDSGGAHAKAIAPVHR